jgi:hypothetical protein
MEAQDEDQQGRGIPAEPQAEGEDAERAGGNGDDHRHARFAAVIDLAGFGNALDAIEARSQIHAREDMGEQAARSPIILERQSRTARLVDDLGIELQELVGDAPAEPMPDCREMIWRRALDDLEIGF